MEGVSFLILSYFFIVMSGIVNFDFRNPFNDDFLHLHIVCSITRECTMSVSCFKQYPYPASAFCCCYLANPLCVTESLGLFESAVGIYVGCTDFDVTPSVPIVGPWDSCTGKQ
jgi:hypothetical protein